MRMDSWSGRVSEVLGEEHPLRVFFKKWAVSHEGVLSSGGEVSGNPSCVPCRWEGPQVIHHSPAHPSMGLSSIRSSAASSDGHLNPAFPKWCSSSVPVLCIFGRTFKRNKNSLEAAVHVEHDRRCSAEIVTFQNKGTAFEKGVHCASGSSKMKNLKTSNMKAVQQGWALQRSSCVFLVVFQWIHSFPLCSATTVPISSNYRNVLIFTSRGMWKAVDSSLQGSSAVELLSL